MVHIVCCFALAYTLTGKPNSRHDSADGLGDGKLVSNYHFMIFLVCAGVFCIELIVFYHNIMNG